MMFWKLNKVCSESMNFVLNSCPNRNIGTSSKAHAVLFGEMKVMVGNCSAIIKFRSRPRPRSLLEFEFRGSESMSFAAAMYMHQSSQ